MAERLKRWIRKPVFWIGAGLLGVLLLAAAAGGIYLTQRPPTQPIQFPHSVHVGLGADCQFCHPAGRWGPAAGLPSTAKCWGCHQQIQRQSPQLDVLASFAQQNQEIPWVPVAMLPEFVQFTHQPHLLAGVDCAACHGNVSEMTVAEPRKMLMGWCLECHRRMAPENAVKLTDCGTCHY